MPATIEQRQKFAQEWEALNKQLLTAYNAVEDHLARWNDLGLSGAYLETDFSSEGSLKHITVETWDLSVSTVQAIQTLMNAGHRGNLNRIIR